MRLLLLLIVASTVAVAVSITFRFYPTEILFTVGGALFGFVLAQAGEALARADLGISVLDDPLNSIGQEGTESWKFLHVVVTNRPGRLKHALFGGHTATFCQADVEFLDASKKRVLFGVDGRWSSTGEPVQILSSGRVFDFSKVPALRFDHITPGKSAWLAIAVKNDGEAEFYGFSNISYAHPKLNNPEWRLEGKSVPVRVTVVAGQGERTTKEFVLLNPNEGVANFKLS
jgi:hypothetical protein